MSSEIKQHLRTPFTEYETLTLASKRLLGFHITAPVKLMKADFADLWSFVDNFWTINGRNVSIDKKVLTEYYYCRLKKIRPSSTRKEDNTGTIKRCVT